MDMYSARAQAVNQVAALGLIAFLVAALKINVGIPPTIIVFGALFFGAAVNREMLWNYKRLGLLPEGTLGREYWKHLTEVGFGFPGEPGGIAESVAYHDIAHVLAEHDTTPLADRQLRSAEGAVGDPPRREVRRRHDAPVGLLAADVADVGGGAREMRFASEARVKPDLRAGAA